MPSKKKKKITEKISRVTNAMKKIKQSNLIITGGERWEDCHAKDLSEKMIRVEMG